MIEKIMIDNIIIEKIKCILEVGVLSCVAGKYCYTIAEQYKHLFIEKRRWVMNSSFEDLINIVEGRINND